MNRRAASLDHPSSAAANRRPWELAQPDDVHWFSYAQTAGDDGIWGAFLYMYVAVTPLICDATFDGSLHRQGTRASIVVGDSDKSRANRIKSRDNSEEVSKFAEVSGEVAALDNVCTISLIPTKDLPEEPADQAGWLAAAQTGEPEALERFFHMYQAQVYTLCLRLLARTEEAEDATQATFVQAFRALPQFQGRSSVRTWLYRIAMNEAYALLRSRRCAPTVLDSTCMAKDDAVNAMERITVHSTLCRLKPDHRAILVLRFWEQLDYEEIAEVLAISLSAVKMRLSRARDAFRNCYDEETR